MISSLALQAPAQVDTVVTVAARDGYDFVQALAAGSVAATFIGVLLVMLFSIIQVYRAGKALERARKQISLDPAVENLRKTTGHLESIAAAFDVEAKRLAGSVSALSDRLTQVSDRMEERIEEFNALMEVVQSEAEGAFVESASAARGVRAGIDHLGSRPRVRREPNRSTDRRADSDDPAGRSPREPSPGDESEEREPHG